MRRYYATVKHHSTRSNWAELKGAKTLTGAKRMATREYGKGYHGHIIHVVGCTPGALESGYINDMHPHMLLKKNTQMKKMLILSVKFRWVTVLNVKLIAMEIAGITQKILTLGASNRRWRDEMQKNR